MIMPSLYNPKAPKKATNLSINSDLLAKSRKLNINLSATLEIALRRKLAEAEEDRWVKQNKTAILAYNSCVDENGCFGDEFRDF
jgi:antitoxin CcdA